MKCVFGIYLSVFALVRTQCLFNAACAFVHIARLFIAKITAIVRPVAQFILRDAGAVRCSVEKQKETNKTTDSIFWRRQRWTAYHIGRIAVRHK